MQQATLNFSHCCCECATKMFQIWVEVHGLFRPSNHSIEVHNDLPGLANSFGQPGSVADFGSWPCAGKAASHVTDSPVSMCVHREVIASWIQSALLHEIADSAEVVSSLNILKVVQERCDATSNFGNCHC